jgi:hypothetical protein
MYPNLSYSISEFELDKEQSCSDKSCKINARKGNHFGDNQENKDSLLCRINLC